MYLKNTFKLISVNLNVAFKAVVFRIAVVASFMLVMYGISYFTLNDVVTSAELGALLADMKALWHQFLGISSDAINLQADVEAFMLLIQSNFGKLIGGLIALSVVFFLMNYVLGLCNFTMSVMLDEHMTSLAKTRFIQVFISILKKAWLFELLFAFVKIIVYAIVIVICLGLVILLMPYISFLSVIISLWVSLAILALYQTLICRLRPRVVHGMKLKDAVKKMAPDKKHFASIYGSQAFCIVLFIYFNVTMFIATLGAGLSISLPLCYMFSMALQLIIDYTIENKRYFIDYDNIVKEREIPVEQDVVLDEVDMM